MTEKLIQTGDVWRDGFHQYFTIVHTDERSVEGRGDDGKKRMFSLDGSFYGGQQFERYALCYLQRRSRGLAEDELLRAAKAALFVLGIVNSREPGTNEAGAIECLKEAIALAERFP